MGCLTCAKRNANIYNQVTLIYDSNDHVEVGPNNIGPRFINMNSVCFSTFDEQVQKEIRHHIGNDLWCETYWKLEPKKKGFRLELSYGNDGMAWMVWSAKLYIFSK